MGCYGSPFFAWGSSLLLFCLCGFLAIEESPVRWMGQKGSKILEVSFRMVKPHGLSFCFFVRWLYFQVSSLSSSLRSSLVMYGAGLVQWSLGGQRKAMGFWVQGQKTCMRLDSAERKSFLSFFLLLSQSFHLPLSPLSQSFLLLPLSYVLFLFDEGVSARLPQGPPFFISFLVSFKASSCFLLILSSRVYP